MTQTFRKFYKGRRQRRTRRGDFGKQKMRGDIKSECPCNNVITELRSCMKVEAAVLGTSVPNSPYRLCGRKAKLKECAGSCVKVEAAVLGTSVPNSPYSLCGRKAKLKECASSCVKVEVAILGSPALIVLIVSADVKQHRTNERRNQLRQSLEEGCRKVRLGVRFNSCLYIYSQFCRESPTRYQTETHVGDKALPVLRRNRFDISDAPFFYRPDLNELTLFSRGKSDASLINKSSRQHSLKCYRTTRKIITQERKRNALLTPPATRTRVNPPRMHYVLKISFTLLA